MGLTTQTMDLDNSQLMKFEFSFRVHRVKSSLAWLHQSDALNGIRQI